MYVHQYFYIFLHYILTSIVILLLKILLLHVNIAANGIAAAANGALTAANSASDSAAAKNAAKCFLLLLLFMYSLLLWPGADASGAIAAAFATIISSDAALSAESIATLPPFGPIEG